jgi:membrane-bound lytic murein transglycosylase D
MIRGLRAAPCGIFVVGEGMLLNGMPRACRITMKRLLVPLLMLAMVTVGHTGGALAGSEVGFPRPASIEPNVRFWIDVFTAYSYRDFIVHDRDKVWREYQVIHLPGSGPPSGDDVDSVNVYLKAKYSDMLNRLASGRKPENYEEEQVARLFKGEPLSAYAVAARNLRVQQGLREQFRETLLRSRYYRPTMERIFRESGVPVELVTLAAVESGFYDRAHSSAGAVGIWQFTRATGRNYMRITRYRDDRLSPLRSTEAAAKLLRYNYDTLHDWPLAITAYDYGTGGTAQAATLYGDDYARVVEEYNGPHFGFAVKNYYPEFLAAMQVHRYEDKYFPGIQYESAPPPRPAVTQIASSPHRHWRWHHATRRAIYRHHKHHRAPIRA